jgi:protein SCO1/2
MGKSFSVKKILILVTILAVPGFLYYLLEQKGKNRYHPLGFFGLKQVMSTFHSVRGKNIPDTLYHTVRDFKLVNQLGDSVRFPVDTAKITVVNFFFSRCPSFCKSMNAEMALVVGAYNKNDFLRFLSISVDPEYDTPAVLFEYAKSYKHRPGKWEFLTGDKKLIYSLAKQDFLVDAIEDTTSTVNFIHSPMLILLDTHKRIRGYYDSGSKEQVDKLADEIKVLIAEELRSVKNPY